MGSHESSALPLHLQNGSLPPVETPVFEHEFMLQHSGSMPLTRVEVPSFACLVKMRVSQGITSSKAASSDKLPQSLFNELASWLHPRITFFKIEIKRLLVTF